MCPVRVDWHAPDSMFQILMVLSSEQLARMLGFWGSKATQRIRLLLANTKLELNYHRKRSFQRDGTYLCPARVDWHAPDSMFQILMVLSLEQLARMLDFWGSKATQRTQSLLTNIELELNYHRSRSFQRDGTYLCSVRGDPTAAPVAASQIRTVLSL